MKKICIAFVLALLLTGCKAVHEIRPDTIVDIPLNPTQPITQPVAETTQPPTDAPTRPPAPEVPTDTGEPTPGAAITPTMPQSYDPGGYVPGSLDRAVAEAVNAARQEAGLTPLTLDTRLCAIASVRAWECATLLSGIRPDGSAGISVLDEYGYSHVRAGEILYFGAGTAEAMVSRWMRLEDTKEWILTEAAVIGVGSHTAPDGITYVAALVVG